MRRKHWYEVTVNGVKVDTKAVSAAQAINNARWRIEGMKPRRNCTINVIRKFQEEGNQQ